MQKLYYLIFLIFCLQAKAQKYVSGGKLKPEQAIMDIRHYTLSLSLDTAGKSIAGFTEIDLILSQATDLLLFDLVSVLTVDKAWVDGRPVAFEQRNDLVYLHNGKSYAPGSHRAKIQYHGNPPVARRAPWDGGFQWEHDSTGHPWIAISCQSEGAKIYFPCKDHPSDEPNEGADLLITVPKGLVVAGPGRLQKVTTRNNKSTYFWRTRYTINNYSILFNVGDYRVVSRTYTTINGHQVPMQFYILAEHFSKAEHHLDMLTRMVRVQEKYFGEYPWVNDKIAIAETPHLGMEHQTMNAYGNKFRYTQVGGEDFDWLMYHEFGHEWWGNKVTGIDWSDMWIQEGICVFGDAMYVRETEGETAFLKSMQQTAFNIQNKKPVVMGKELNSDTVYHSDIYGKGAFFMHSLRYILGDSVFFPAIKKLATDSSYTYDRLVSTEDVEHLFEKASGKDLKAFFDLFLRTTEKLQISVRQTKLDQFQVRLLNYAGTLPVEITTNSGTAKILVDQKGIEIKSTVTPVIDPHGYFLKQVILE